MLLPEAPEFRGFYAHVPEFLNHAVGRVKSEVVLPLRERVTFLGIDDPQFADRRHRGWIPLRRQAVALSLVKSRSWWGHHGTVADFRSVPGCALEVHAL